MGKRILISLALFLSLTLHSRSFVPAQKYECVTHWNSQGLSSDEVLYSPSRHQNYASFYKLIDRKNCYKEWLIAIYIAADNDLSPYSYRDLWEMEQVGSTYNVDVIVFHDDFQQKDGLRYYHLFKAPPLTGENGKKFSFKEAINKFVKRPENQHLLEEDDISQEQAYLWKHGTDLISADDYAVHSLPEGDSGEVSVARNFLAWAFENYPSKRIALVGWSHGQGFDADPTGDPLLEHREAFSEKLAGRQGGFAFDETSNSHMMVTKMTEVRSDRLAKVLGDRLIDIAGSDSCLNQQVEFGYEWLGLAEYVYGAAPRVQKRGFNYRPFIELFDKHSSSQNGREPEKTEFFARLIPKIYGISISQAPENSDFASYRDPNATLSTWDMVTLPDVKSALDHLGKFLSHWLTDPKVSPLKLIERTEKVQSLIPMAIRHGGISNDLYHFLEVLRDYSRELSKEEEYKEFALKLRALTNEARASVRSSVDDRYFIGENYFKKTKGREKLSYGVAVWLPLGEDEFKEMFPKFASGQFYRDSKNKKKLSGWGSFVRSLYPHVKF